MAYDMGTLGGFRADDPRNNIGRGSLSNAVTALKSKLKSWGRSRQPELAGIPSEPVIDLSGPAAAVTAWDDQQRNGTPAPAAAPVLGTPAVVPAPAVIPTVAAAPPVVAPAPMDLTAANNQAKLGAVPRAMDVIQPAAPVVAAVDPAAATDASRAAYAASPNSIENQSIKRMADKATQDKIAGLNATIASVPSEYDRAFVGKADMSNPSFRNAQAVLGVSADKVTAAQSELASITGQQNIAQDAAKTAAALEGQKYIADAGVTGHKISADATLGSAKLGLEGHKYTADQGLEGHKYTADAAENAKIESARLKATAMAAEDKAKTTQMLRGKGATPDMINRYHANEAAVTQHKSDVIGVFNKASSPELARAHMATYQAYTQATPDQRKEMEKQSDVQSMKDFVSKVGKKPGLLTKGVPSMDADILAVLKTPDPTLGGV